MAWIARSGTGQSRTRQSMTAPSPNPPIPQRRQTSIPQDSPKWFDASTVNSTNRNQIGRDTLVPAAIREATTPNP